MEWEKTKAWLNQAEGVGSGSAQANSRMDQVDRMGSMARSHYEEMLLRDPNAVKRYMPEVVNTWLLRGSDAYRRSDDLRLERERKVHAQMIQMAEAAQDRAERRAAYLSRLQALQELGGGNGR